MLWFLGYGGIGGGSFWAGRKENEMRNVVLKTRNQKFAAKMSLKHHRLYLQLFGYYFEKYVFAKIGMRRFVLKIPGATFNFVGANLLIQFDWRAPLSFHPPSGETNTPKRP